MGFIPDVLPNTVITSTWGNLIRDHVVSVLDSASELPNIARPHDGQLVYLDNPPSLLLYTGSTWRTVAKWEANVAQWVWVDVAWGEVGGSKATVGNPNSDIIMNLSGDGGGGPGNYVTVSGSGFGPITVTSPGNRVLYVSGMVRVDGGGLTSAGGSSDYLIQRDGGTLASAIITMESYSSNDPSRVVSLFAIDAPSAGSHTYSLLMRMRSGLGVVRLMSPLAMAVVDQGPVTSQALKGGLQL